MLAALAMDERKLLALGVLLGAASGKPPGQWLTAAHEFFRQEQRKDPMNATALAVLAAAAGFYVAERGENPKIASFLDALIYSSTNISVGYSDIFARTPLGKAIGSALMTYGPALASRTFDDAGSGDAQIAPRGRQQHATTRKTNALPAEEVATESADPAGDGDVRDDGNVGDHALNTAQLEALNAIAEKLDAILTRLGPPPDAARE